MSMTFDIAGTDERFLYKTPEVYSNEIIDEK